MNSSPNPHVTVPPGGVSLSVVRSSVGRTARLPILVVLLLGAALARCGADSNPPDRLVYQGYLSSGGTALGNAGPVNTAIEFRIYKHQTSSSEGETLWAESQTVTVDKGNFSVILGNGDAVTVAPGTGKHGSLAAVFKGGNVSGLYIGMKVSAISSSEITPRLQFLPSPIAFLAQRANSLVKPDGVDAVTVDTTGMITATKFSGEFSGNGASLTGLNASSLATGTIADDRIGSVTASKLTGAKTLPDNVLSANIPRLDAANTFAAETTFTKKATFNGAVVANASITSAGKIESTGTAGFAGRGIIPVKGIIMFSGSASEVPAGWALCDGNNGTPDLRDKFIRGATGYGHSTTTSGKIEYVGGANSVTLSTANMPPHTHAFDDYYLVGDTKIADPDTQRHGDSYTTRRGGWGVGGQSLVQDKNGFYFRATTTDSAGGNSSGTTVPVDILPPFYTLAFIMRTE